MAFGFESLRALRDKIRVKGLEVARTAKKIAKDDPRKVIHSLKVGLALTLIALYYYFQPLYDGFGVDAMWAVLTVVLVLEFSVGATIGKLVNRIAATLTAGALAVGLHRLATFSGEIGEPILIALFVFLIGAITTFMRFYPTLKARYDYGLLIFLLTFCLVIVSGYRDVELFEIAHKRLSTIVVGCITAIVICVCICPVWIGADLHKLVASNMEKLGDFLEEFGGEYFTTTEDNGQRSSDKNHLAGYRSVLNSKTPEENMANLARWEPCHGRFRFYHPWNQYLKVGALSRQCACKLDALYCYLNSEIQTPTEIQRKIQEPCTIICSESGKALKELAATIKRSNLSSFPSSQIELSKAAVNNLKSILNTQPLWEDEEDILEIIPAVAVASQLISVVSCVEKIGEAVIELASLAGFKKVDNNILSTTPEPQEQNILHQGVVVPVSDGPDVVIIAVEEHSSPLESPVISRP